MNKIFQFTSVLLLPFYAIGGSSAAQELNKTNVDSASTLTSTEDENREIEKIIVTSTKVARSAQDIGLAVTAMSGEEIRNRGINDIEGLIETTPGASFTSPTGGGIPVVIIRGVGLQNFRINDSPTTAIYADEVYQTSVAQAVATMFDVERVEVLKGPQGGLYGRNAVGGAIQIISAKPNFDETEGYFSAGVESYSRYETEAVLSGPLSEKFAYRVGGKMVKANEGYFHSVPGNYDYGAEDKWASRAQLAYRPNDDVQVLFKLHGGADKSELPLAQTTGLYRPLGLGLATDSGLTNTADGAILNLRAATASLDYICDSIINSGVADDNCETVTGSTMSELGLNSRYDSDSLAKPALDNSWLGSSVLVDSKWGDYNFTSVSAFDSFEHKRYIDQDAVAAVNQEIDYKTKIDAWSQEFRLGYDGSDDFSWVIGANYSEDKLVEDSTLFAGGLLSLQLGGATIAKQDYEQETKAAAIYGHSDWQFAPKFNLVLEARYTKEDKSLLGGTGLPQASVTLSHADDEKSFSSLSGKVGLEYKPTTNSLLYTSVSKGFKSGGFFGGFATSNAQLEPFDNEVINALEIGFKHDFNNQPLRLNGSAFYYDRQGVQANGLDMSGVVPISRLTNVGDVETTGAELEVVWYATSNLIVRGGVAYVDTEFVKTNILGTDLFKVNRAAEIEGSSLPNQPKISSNFTLRYEDELGDSMWWFTQLEYSYRSEQDYGIIATEQDKAFMTEAAYNLVNFRASLLSEDSGWAVSAYVTNLFDETYRSDAGISSPSGLEVIYGAPRIVGAEISYQF